MVASETKKVKPLCLDSDIYSISAPCELDQSTLSGKTTRGEDLGEVHEYTLSSWLRQQLFQLSRAEID